VEREREKRDWKRNAGEEERKGLLFGANEGIWESSPLT